MNEFLESLEQFSESLLEVRDITGEQLELFKMAAIDKQLNEIRTLSDFRAGSKYNYSHFLVASL